MQNGTKNKKKTAPVICAAIAVVFLGAVLAALLFPLLGEARGELAVTVFVLIYGGLIAAMIVGVIGALRQRLKEIEGGEEEDARKY